MVSQKISRLEANREVRRIFVSHGIDTTIINFSVAGRSLVLTGAIFKEGGHDVETKIIDTIMQELSRMGLTISCELDNWIITDGSIAKKGAAATNTEAEEIRIKEAVAAALNKNTG